MPPLDALLLAALLCLHLLAATFWVGGMAAMHFAVRPAAQQTLESPPLRLRFMAAALERFLHGVGAAIGLLWLSGAALLVGYGGGHPHWSTLAMLGAGAFMTVIYLQIRLRSFRRLRSAVGLGQWPTAADALGSIRRLVALNLVLGVLVFPVTLIGRLA